jgi:intracellular septation protein
MTQPDPATPKPLRKLLIEFGPLVAFFLTQRFMDLYWATGVFMLAISVSLLVSRRIERKWPVVPLVTAVFVLVLGGLTLWLQDSTFIMMKPTIVNLIFAGILLVGLARQRLFLKTVFAEAFDLEDEGWSKLTLRFGLFFVFLAGLNEIVWRTQSEDVWTSFKVFGILPITLAFMYLQGRLVERYTRPKS